MDRGRTAPPRVPGHPREDPTRCLVHLQHEVDARRGLAGPEEIRRSRTAAPGGLRGDEAAGEDDSAAGKTRLPKALDRLIELYTATNKPDEVKKWQAERAKYPEDGPDAGGEEVIC